MAFSQGYFEIQIKVMFVKMKDITQLIGTIFEMGIFRVFIPSLHVIVLSNLKNLNLVTQTINTNIVRGYFCLYFSFTSYFYFVFILAFHFTHL